MEKKFKIEKINNNIYKIQETWFKEHANLYLFSGKNSSLLIDAGLGVFDIKKFLEKEGFKNVKVALTHAHFDHFGGIRYFLPKEIFITKKIYKNIKNKRLFGLEFLNPKDFSEKINYINAKTIFESYNISAKPKTINNIKIGKFNFKIIETPGHTDDSVVYFDKNNGILVTGDTLYDGKIYLNFLNSNVKEFKNSLTKINGLNFKTVLPGHNRSLDKNDTKKIIKKIDGLCQLKG